MSYSLSVTVIETIDELFEEVSCNLFAETTRDSNVIEEFTAKTELKNHVINLPLNGLSIGSGFGVSTLLAFKNLDDVLVVT